MKIRSVTTDGFVGVTDGVYTLADDTGRAQPLVVVTGPAAAGKSSLLEAIAIGVEDVVREGKPNERAAGRVRGDSAAAKIQITWELSEEEALRVASDALEITSETILTWGPPDGPPAHDPALAALFGAYAHLPQVGKVELFAEQRALVGDRGFGSRGLVAEAAQRPLRLSRDRRKYAFVQPLLAHLVARGATPFVADVRSRFDRAMTALGASMALAGVDAEGGVFFAGEGTQAELGHLPRGDQEAVLFAATAALVALDHSVLLVDRPEQHLGCTEVARFVAGLRALGADNQLIVATSSRELVAAAPAEAVITLRDPNQNTNEPSRSPAPGR